jgi:hypothetical protein
MRGFVMLAAGAVALGGPAYATPVTQPNGICVSVTTTGTVPFSRSQCVAWPGVECLTPDAGLDPAEHVYVVLCVPS